MKIEPNTTITLPLSAAYELAPYLRHNVEALTSCGWGVDNSVFIPAACPLTKVGEEFRELEGLLDAEQLDCPGVLVVLPPAAAPYLDDLLEKPFEALTMQYDGLLKCKSVLMLSTDTSSLAIDWHALWGLVEGASSFFLAIACADELRIRRICNQKPLDEYDLQSLSFSELNYEPYRIFSEQELKEAAEEELANRDAPHWLVMAAARNPD